MNVKIHSSNSENLFHPHHFPAIAQKHDNTKQLEHELQKPRPSVIQGIDVAPL